MADIIEYTVDERPIYGFELTPEAPVGSGRTYRGGGYFTHNEHAAWCWVSLFINGQRVVDARLLAGSLQDWPAAIEAAVHDQKHVALGFVHPDPELTFTVEPSVHRLARQLGVTPEELEPEQLRDNAAFLDFSLDDGVAAAPREEGETDGDDVAAASFDVSFLVDGGLIAGFGVARGGPAIVMNDLDGEVLLQFASELRDDLIAAGIIDPEEEEADNWEEFAPEEDQAPADEVEGEVGGFAPETRWAEHYLARPEYREVLEDFLTYIPAGSPVLEIGSGTGEGAAEALTDLGYKVTATDSWTPSLQVASENEDLTVEWADVVELEYEQEFAGAVAFHAFLHLDRADLDAALRSVWRSLKDNGVFLLVLDPAQELLSAPSSPDALGAMDFIADFTHGEIVEAARNAGFEVLHDLAVEPLEDAREWEERGKGRALILQALQVNR